MNRSNEVAPFGVTAPADAMRCAVAAESDVITFVYRNWRGEVAERRVDASSARFYTGATEWHPDTQMLLGGWDMDKGDHRDFAVKDILHFGPVAATAPLQERVMPWLVACFGAEIASDKLERADRLLEEVFETLQAVDYPRERIRALEGYVFEREKGDLPQEVGGVMTTLAGFCLAHGIDMHEAGETELARVWTKVEKIRAKQAAKPVGSALAVAASPAAPAPAGNGGGAGGAATRFASRSSSEGRTPPDRYGETSRGCDHHRARPIEQRTRSGARGAEKPARRDRGRRGLPRQHQAHRIRRRKPRRSEDHCGSRGCRPFQLSALSEQGGGE